MSAAQHIAEQKQEACLARYLWLLMIAATLLAGCGGELQSVNALNPTVGPDNAVAKITYPDGSVEYISQSTLDSLRQTIYIDPRTGEPGPAAGVLDELITRRLLLRQARNQDIVGDTQQIERTIANVRTNPNLCGGRVADQSLDVNSRAYLDACAQAYGFEDATAFRNFIAEEVAIDRVSREFADQDQIRAAHILFANEDHALAQEIYDRICGQIGIVTESVDPGVCRGQNADFAALAGQYSIEPGADQSGGELPPFNQQGLTANGQPFDTTFVSNTWALHDAYLEQGAAVSRPFQTQFGWHIVKILDLEASNDAIFNYRQAILEAAKNADPSGLGQPQTGGVPLLGSVEILADFPPEQVEPSLPPVVPEESPDATGDVPAEGTATPDETATATP
jgi:hypothetical protein